MKYVSLCMALFVISALASCGSEPKEQVIVNNSRQVPKTNGSNKVVINTRPPASPIDQSPMDMVYYPIEYAKLKSQGKGGAMPYLRIIYSRPHRHGRKIFGNLQKYGSPWRLGANEATEIELFRNANINGKKLAKGRYIMYCIPEAEKWTIVFNSNIFTWGLQFDKTLDVMATEIPVEMLPEPSETFTMLFEGTEDKATLIMEWDDVRARLPIHF